MARDFQTSNLEIGDFYDIKSGRNLGNPPKITDSWRDRRIDSKIGGQFEERQRLMF